MIYFCTILLVTLSKYEYFFAAVALTLVLIIPIIVVGLTLGGDAANALCSCIQAACYIGALTPSPNISSDTPAKSHQSATQEFKDALQQAKNILDKNDDSDEYESPLKLD